jgi:multicomponent Na+:H+ antiporter subunit D
VKIIVYIFGTPALMSTPATQWILYIAGASIILASVIALRQDNLKRRLAYSTISQLSYVTMAALILAPLSMIAAMLHIAVHAFGKITLFFAAGSIYTASHKTRVSQLDGIGRRMPWTMSAFTVGAVSMIGLPPAAGFLSKWFMLQGAFNQQAWFATAVIILSTLLNASYFAPIVYRAWFRPFSGEQHGEAPLAIVLALTVTALLTIGLFFYPDILLHLAQQVQGGKS